MWETIWNMIVDALLWLPRVLYSFMADVIAFFMSLLPSEPLPIQDAFTDLTGDLLYFLDIVEFQFGLTMIFSALIARFILRRVPFIG